ncbi:hypothetical protein SAMN02982918_1500 [Saccharomonospora viridis]|nr:hypothetical protein [Saccharomonospora viridis]SFP17213.1 hypothetical protein SAMN02982918_1500 [Saccharomonospora viridis]
MRCASCRRGLDHCHGTVVLHGSGDFGGVECTEPDCVDVEPARHLFVIGCGSVEGGCACAAAPAMS